ncbi:ABC transporter permease [Streptomyces populi]
MTFQKETVSLRIVGEVFDTSDDGMRVHADLDSFAKAEPGIFHIESAPEGENMIVLLEAMAALLILMPVSVAGLGVLNSVVLDTRERVHDLGVCKALGMSPRGTVGLVLASVAGIGVVGGLIGVPTGFALHGYVLPVMGRSAGTGLPPSVLDAYDTAQPVPLGLAGVLVAVLGAMAPAGRAARVRTASGAEGRRQRRGGADRGQPQVSRPAFCLAFRTRWTL